MSEVRNDGDQKVVQKYLISEIFYGRQEVHKCSVNLCFCTSGDGIDGSGRCFLEYEDSLHTTRRTILTESEGTERD